VGRGSRRFEVGFPAADDEGRPRVLNWEVILAQIASALFVDCDSAMRRPSDIFEIAKTECGTIADEFRDNIARDQ
jgi:hypothetical protein